MGCNVILCFCRTDIPMEVQCPSTGILSLASLLETGGEHRVRVVLAAEYPSFRADLERQLAMSDVLGISATSYNWYVARELIAAAREIKPRLTIVLGGIHPSHLPEYCLASTQADVVVRGEAEITFPSLLDTLARGGELGRIHGLTFRTEDGRIVSTPDRPALSVEEMEKLPLPAYHLIPPGVYGYIPVEGSRGCAFDCAFCGIYYRRGHRAFSPSRMEAVVRRLRAIENRFHARSVFFTDDSFGTRKSATRGLLDAFASTGYSLGMESRYHDLVHPKLIDALDRNRFYLIQVGVEAGYQQGVDKVDKKLDLARIYRFAEAIARRPIRSAVHYSMALGLPWENESHLLTTVNVAHELAARSGSPPPMLNNFNPLPGSRFVARPADYGLPPLGPAFWDDGNWFRPFLGFCKIPEANRNYLGRYIGWRRLLHPRLPSAPVLRFPDGQVLNNVVWNTEKVPLSA